jgi:t-SNARE complex subunit (syntaxin)
MNILEVSILVADLTILIGGFAIFNRIVKKKIKSVEDNINYIEGRFQNRLFEVESFQRYDLKFELNDIKNKLELLEVKVSKASFDFEEFKFHILTKQQAENLAKTIVKSMAESNTEEKETITTTKPSESVQNEVVDLIKDDLVTIDEVTQQTELNFKEKPKRKQRKKEVKTNITPHQIEESFIERYGMTYYGYRKMYGEKKFIKAKNNAYMRVYYKQITKKETK